MTAHKKLQNHLLEEHYRAARELQGGPGSLGRRLLDHLPEICRECRRYWHQLGRLRTAVLDRLDELRLAGDGRSADPLEWSVTEEDLEEAEREEKEMRRRRRRSWEQKSKLLRTPLEKRVEKIKNARTQFKSQLLAEELLDEGQARMRTNPHGAVEVFELIPHILRDAVTPYGPEWAWSFYLRSRAWEANALRIAGELREAGQVFSELHQDIAKRPTTNIECGALLASLEAGLLIEELHFEEGEELLEKAATLYELAGARRGHSKVGIKQANLLSRQGEAEKALTKFESAASNLDPHADADLLLPAVIGRIKVLCDLDRAAEAHQLLRDHVDLFEGAEEVYGGAYYRALEGRIALALEDHELAEESFETSVEAFLTLDRSYDATLAALDLAKTYLLVGKLRELRQLIPPILSRLASHGVSKKTAEVLALLRQSIRSEQLSLAFLAELRNKLQSRA